MYMYLCCELFGTYLFGALKDALIHLQPIHVLTYRWTCVQAKTHLTLIICKYQVYLQLLYLKATSVNQVALYGMHAVYR